MRNNAKKTKILNPHMQSIPVKETLNKMENFTGVQGWDENKTPQKIVKGNILLIRKGSGS